MAESAIEKHRPIRSELKTKKIKWREPEDPIRWAFEKELREHDKTRRVHAVDPYAEVYQFRDNLYGIFTESLDGMGDPWMYLIIGPEKAMLLDTGFGIGNLQGLVNEITGGMPLIVANSHSHFDHAYGNYPFDRVYCHEYEVPRLLAKRNPQVWDYLFDASGRCIWTEFDRNDLVSFREYEIVGCPNGHVFNLGSDYEIELVLTAGHTPGHAAYLDKKNRILFPGDDACCGSLGISGPTPGESYGEYATVTGLRNELVKLVKRIDEFDCLFPGHGLVELGPILLVNILETCEKVVADPEHCDFVTRKIMADQTISLRYNRMIYRSGCLCYSLSGV
jgi:glyoxylase-like metal-dependent hydrolase (beta-lactamase superfamily II)